MLKVRRSLTEILLEVTNEEITAVCREVWSRARAKGTPDTHDRTNQLNFRQAATKLCDCIYNIKLKKSIKQRFINADLIIRQFQDILLFLVFRDLRLA